MLLSKREVLSKMIFPRKDPRRMAVCRGKGLERRMTVCTQHSLILKRSVHERNFKVHIKSSLN